jgi:hypothetical protein
MVFLPESGYGIALLSNSRMPLESDAEAAMEDIVALNEGARFPLACVADLTVLAVGFDRCGRGNRTAWWRSPRLPLTR